MKKKMIVFCLIVVVLTAGVLLYEPGDSNSGTVDTLHVGTGDIVDVIKVRGKVESVSKAVIRAGEEMRIQKILVKEGETAVAGEELLLIDCRDRKDAVQRARLELKRCETGAAATLRRLKASEQTYSDPMELRINFKAKEFEYQQSVIAKQAAQREADISNELYKVGAESWINLKAKQDRLKDAEIQLSRAKEELNDARQHFDKKEKTSLNRDRLKSEHEDALQRTELARIELDLALNRLNRLKVTARMSGTVVKVDVKPGMVISAGMELMTIADLDRLRVCAHADELDAARIKKGQESLISFEGLPGKKLKGCVEKIAPLAIINEGRAFVKTEILIDEQATGLRISNQVDVKIIVQRKKDVLRIPLRAVHHGDHIFVWRVRNGVAEKAKVETGLSDVDWIEITGGLKQGDAIIDNPSVILAEGKKITTE